MAAIKAPLPPQKNPIFMTRHRVVTKREGESGEGGVWDTSLCFSHIEVRICFCMRADQKIFAF